MRRVLTEVRQHYLELLARVSNGPERDMFIKGYLEALEFVFSGKLTQSAKSVLGIEEDNEKPEPVEDIMPREREIKPDGR